MTRVGLHTAPSTELNGLEVVVVVDPSLTVFRPAGLIILVYCTCSCCCSIFVVLLFLCLFFIVYLLYLPFLVEKAVNLAAGKLNETATMSFDL